MFISYSRDSVEHQRRVLELAQQLRRDGIDAWLDLFEQAPPQGWPRWMTAEVQRADFLLLVCTETYRRRFEGEDDGASQNATFEGLLANQLIHDRKLDLRRTIPVLFADGSPEAIPPVVGGASRYLLPEDYERLRVHLAGQPAVKPEPVRGVEVFAGMPAKPGPADELALLRDERARMIIAGEDPTSIEERILELRRRMRNGPNLAEGEILCHRYRLVRMAGQGGFAAVWKAYDLQAGELVAVKVLHGQWLADKSRVDRFESGARKMASLRHPGIVPIFGEPESDGHHRFCVMPWFERGDLYRAVTSGAIDRAGALRALISAIDGLAYAHAKGIVHRDVKPQNIMIDDEGRGLLSDFDLVHAKDTTKGTRTGSGMGTLIYAAPEQLQDAKRADEKVDIYAAGMCVLFALRGSDPPPWVSKVEPEYFDGIECSEKLLGVVRGAVAHSRIARFTTCNELLAAIRHELERPWNSWTESERSEFNNSAGALVRSQIVRSQIPPRASIRREAVVIPEDISRKRVLRVASITALGVGIFVVGGLVAKLLTGDEGFFAAHSASGKGENNAPHTNRRHDEGAIYKVANLAASEAITLAEEDPRTATLMAAAALSVIADDPVFAGSDPDRALRTSLGRTRGRALIDEGHAGSGWPVGAVAISPTGDKAIATTGNDAMVWNLEEGSIKPVYLRGHQGPIQLAEATPDGRWLVTAAEDRTIRLWDLRADDPSTDARILREHKGRVDRLDFSTNGRWMVSSSSEDGRPQIWDLHAADPTNPTGVIAGHDGGSITDVAMAADGSFIATASFDSSVKVWPLDNGRPGRPRILKAHKAPVLAIDVSADGRWLVSASQDRSAKLWDLNSPVPVRTVVSLLGHKGLVTKVAITPDSKLAVTASNDKTLKIWDLTHKDPATTRVTFGIKDGHEGDIDDLRVDATSSWAVTAGEDAKVIAWNLAKRALVVESVVFPDHTGGTSSIAISADGRWLVSGSVNGNAYVWDYRDTSRTSNANSFPARTHTGPINDIAISRDGKRFLTVGGDNQAVLWDLEPSGRPYPRDLLRGHQKPINAAALAPNGRFAATGGQDQKILLWDIVKGDPNESVKPLEGHEGEVTDLLFSSDGEWLFSAGTDKSVRAWKAEAGWTGVELFGHNDEVVRLAITRDDRLLVSADVAGQLRTWDLKAQLGQPKQQFRPHEREIWTLVFSDDGKWMLSGSADRNARLWKVNHDGLGDKAVVLRGHTDTINTASFSPDGKWIATGSRDGTIRLWQLDSKYPNEGSRIFEMLESKGVEWVLFGPDSKRLYAGNGDGTVHIWYPEPLPGRDDHQILTGHEKKVSALVMPIDGSYLLTGSYDGTARVWPMNPREMIRLACHTAGRNPTEAEWAIWLPGQPYTPICG